VQKDFYVGHLNRGCGVHHPSIKFHAYDISSETTETILTKLDDKKCPWLVLLKICVQHVSYMAFVVENRNISQLKQNVLRGNHFVYDKAHSIIPTSKFVRLYK
jgi:hypothetical protein